MKAPVPFRVIKNAHPSGPRPPLKLHPKFEARLRRLDAEQLAILNLVAAAIERGVA